jgi:uncharacterized protein (TIGR02001 family)
MQSTNFKRFAFIWAALVAAGAQAQPAASGEAAPSATVSGNLALTSQYVSRGFRQTWGKPALQGGADYVHPSGFSAGTWLSTVSNRFIENGTLEWDLYGGYSGAAGDLGYSAIVYYYKYPGAEYRATATTYDYGELSLGATYKMFYAKYNVTWTSEFFGITNARGTGYLDAGANIDLGSGYTLNLHAGDGRVRGAGNDIWNWRDVKVGVTRAFDGGWNVAGAYTKANAATAAYDNYTLGIPNSAGVIETSNPGAGTFVLSLSRTF